MISSTPTRELPASQDISSFCQALAQRARAAARGLASARGEAKNRWLERVASALAAHSDQILKANETDLAEAGRLGISSAAIDRLRLTRERLGAVAEGVRTIAALAEPVGRTLDSSVRPNGLRVSKVAVPLGVILFIYESRPNVTVDAAALCVKSGNAIILRGGKEALRTNAALTEVLRRCLTEVDLPIDAVQLVDTADRSAVGALLKLDSLIDLVIPRGGESLIRRVADEARMPVLKHYKGNCHVYIDRAADLVMAENIVINAKCQRPGVCNAAESLLVHRDVAQQFLPRVAAALRRQGVEIRGCEATRGLVAGVKPATEEDYAAEYLELIISVRVVDDLEAALAHISRYGSRHTEAIVTGELAAANRFMAEVDAAAVMVNASTRFNDGFEFGLGAEIGISTDKFHARGPCGLLELMSYKYIVYGEGHVRGS
jgi:glutamate-5-semialdehyde dehydrogenase